MIVLNKTFTSHHHNINTRGVGGHLSPNILSLCIFRQILPDLGHLEIISKTFTFGVLASVLGPMFVKTLILSL